MSAKINNFQNGAPSSDLQRHETAAPRVRIQFAAIQISEDPFFIETSTFPAISVMMSTGRILRYSAAASVFLRCRSRYMTSSIASGGPERWIMEDIFIDITFQPFS
jgi:hypothetical protein